MKKITKFGFVFFSCMIFPLNVKAQVTPNPVVVELFTSQSCSSCPPADDILNELSSKPNVIALGCHVTYWNHLSWKDTLSLQDCTNLQNDFNAQRGSRRVYTPQMVVNGADEFVGSNKSKAFTAIEKKSSVVVLHPTIENAALSVDIPPALKKSGAPSTLYLYGFKNEYTQVIKSGENGGITQTYAHPVTFVLRIKDWNSDNEKVTMPLPSTPSESYAVILREGGAGKVLAAGTIEKGL